MVRPTDRESKILALYLTTSHVEEEERSQWRRKRRPGTEVRHQGVQLELPDLVGLVLHGLGCLGKEGEQHRPQDQLNLFFNRTRENPTLRRTKYSRRTT